MDLVVLDTLVGALHARLVLDALLVAFHARLVLDALVVALHTRLVLDALLVVGASSITRGRLHSDAQVSTRARKHQTVYLSLCVLSGTKE